MEIIKLQYDNYLADNPEIAFEIRCAIESGLKILVKAPTGSGKTVQIGQIAHKILEDEALSGEEQSKIILACPNVVQNKQNEQNQLVKAKSFTQGEQIQGNKFISAVYDKTFLAIKGDEKVHLILDEAHKRIYDESYRAQALEQVDLSSENAYSVTHITATPRVLLEDMYKYDKYIICESKYSKSNNNIENFEILTMDNKNRKTTLINLLLEKCKNKDKSTTILCRLNSVEDINSTIETLNILDSNIQIQKIISKDKTNNPVFNSIVESGSLGVHSDIVFTTSLLDAGTSLYDKNIELIYHTRTSHDVVIDDIEQFFARTRNKIKKAIITCSIEDKNTRFKPLKQIKNVNNRLRKERVNDFNNLISTMLKLNTPKHEIIEFISKRLSFDFEDFRSSLGCIQLNKETLECFINRELAQASDFKEYDRQFYSKPNRLMLELTDRIKADKFELNHYTALDKKINEIIKEDKNKKEDENKSLKEECKKILQDKSISENCFFVDLLNNNDLILENLSDEKENQLNLFDNKMSIKEQFKLLKEQETLLNSIRDLMSIGMEQNQAIQIVAYAEKPKDIRIAKETYQAILLNTKKRYSMINDEFTKMHRIIREECKSLEKNRKRITDDVIEKINIRLVSEGIIKQRKNPKNKILELIELIYNTSLDSKYVKISSLKKNLKTLK